MYIVQFVMFRFALWIEVLKMGGGSYENSVKYFVLIFLGNVILIDAFVLNDTMYELAYRSRFSSVVDDISGYL